MKRSRFCMALFILFSAIHTASAGEFGINIHGLSFHPARSDSSGNRFNEINLGAGFNYVARRTKETVLTFEGGYFHNSFRDPAFYTSVSWKYQFTEQISAGLAASGFYSSSYNDGEPFLAPFPVLTYRQGPVAFNLIHFPRIKDINQISVFGLYATFYFGE